MWVVSFVIYCVVIGFVVIVYYYWEFWYGIVIYSVYYFGVVFNNVFVFGMRIYYKIRYIM